MAGLIDNFMQGYINRVNSSMNRNGEGNDALSAQTTSDAYQRLQQAIQADYDQQKALAEKNGQQWQMPSPTERFNDQVQAMIISGDPNLQKRGLSLLDAPKEEATTTLEKTANLLGLTPMQVFQMQHPGPASTRVSVHIPKQEQMVTIEDSQKIYMPDGSHPPIGMSYSQVAQLGGRAAETSDQSKAGQATDTLGGAMNDIRNNIDASSTPISGAVTAIRTQPGMVGQLVNTVANAAGIPMKPADVQFQTATRMATGQVTNLMNGAGASEGERDYWATLQPLPTDDAITRRIKFNQQNDFIRNMTERARARGAQVPEYKVKNLPVNGNNKQSSPQQSQQAPQTHTSKSGITFTVK